MEHSAATPFGRLRELARRAASQARIGGRIVVYPTLVLTVGACRSPTPAELPTPEVEVRHGWDGTSSVRSDGHRFTIAAPLLWIAHGDSNVLDPSEAPLTQRCLLLARGVPYLRDTSGLYGFEDASDTWPKESVERRDLCAQAFGAGWRLPQVEELRVIAPHVATQTGSGGESLSAFAMDALGRVTAFQYVVPACFLGERCDTTPRAGVSDRNEASVVCLGPSDTAPSPAPRVEELRGCVERLSSFVETSYRILHRTIDPDLVDLASAVHDACDAGSDLDRWRSVVGWLGREGRETPSERLLSNEATFLEIRLKVLEQAAAQVRPSPKNRADCEALPASYERKCSTGTGNSSCLGLQLRYAVGCESARPEARIQAVAEELAARLEQVRRSRRRAATLVLAVRRAHRCLTASGPPRAAERQRLAAQLPPVGETEASGFDRITPYYCTCALADLECGLDALRTPEACPTERPTANPAKPRAPSVPVPRP